MSLPSWLGEAGWLVCVERTGSARPGGEWGPAYHHWLPRMSGGWMAVLLREAQHHGDTCACMRVCMSGASGGGWGRLPPCSRCCAVLHQCLTGYPSFPKHQQSPLAALTLALASLPLELAALPCCLPACSLAAGS